MLSLTPSSASQVVIGDVADEFMPLCQRVHATTVTVYMTAGIWTGVASDTGSQAKALMRETKKNWLIRWGRGGLNQEGYSRIDPRQYFVLRSMENFIYYVQN